MMGNLNHEARKISFFLSFFLSFFIILMSFYLFILDVKGYCSTWSQSVTLRHLVGLVWTTNQPDKLTSTWPHTVFTRDTHVSGVIRNSNPSKRAAVDPHLRPRSHRDRPKDCHEQKLEKLLLGLLRLTTLTSLACCAASVTK